MVSSFLRLAANFSDTRFSLQRSALVLGFVGVVVCAFNTAAYAQQRSSSVEVTVNLHQMIPMRDGVKLAATVWKPANLDQPLPTVLVMTPYISDETQKRAMRFARNGYVYVSVDVRGRGTSGGKYTPLYGNGPDGEDVIEWLVQQPWSDGRVVMRGGSYRGMVQWQVMAEHPRHLVATVPTAAVYPGYDFPQPKGIFMSYMTRWLAFTSGKTGHDNLFADVGYWRRHFVDAYEKNQPFYKLADLAGANRDVFLKWLAHPAYDDFWRSHNPRPEDYAKIDIPVLTITGYFDGDQRGALRYYREFMGNASEQAKSKFYLLIGPWSHHGTREPSRKLGGLSFPKNSVLDIDGLHIAYFDWLLKEGKRPQILGDRVNYYVMGKGVWRHAPSLDALSDHALHLYLSSPDNSAHDAFHSGWLVTEKPYDQPVDVFHYDPLNLESVGELMESSQLGFLVNPANAYQSNRLIYTSEAFEHPLTIAGTMQVLANISLDVPDTDIAVEVDAILPDGRTLVLGRDFVRARFRASLSEPSLVESGAIEPYRFDGFDFMVRQLPEGARLRVVLSPINLPVVQKNYNSGGRIGYETAEDAQTATITLHLSPRHASYIELPVAAQSTMNGSTDSGDKH